uniref:type I restriction-modification system subunit M N-terminal domain-containing protein n=1 Tax=Xanthomonas arboricola TaxID=56448 RepID=UPI0005845F42
MTSTEQKIERFIAALTSLGGSAGNQRLREELGWQDSTYQRIKQQLIDDGRIRAGRGRGGSVALATTKAPAVPDVALQSKPARAKPAAAPLKRESVSELDYADKLWKTADKLRGNMEPSDYKHVVLGLIFLKYISDLRFPHISSCKIKHLMGEDVEEGARMGHASR